jgi:hypothetical protein
MINFDSCVSTFVCVYPDNSLAGIDRTNYKSYKATNLVEIAFFESQSTAEWFKDLPQNVSHKLDIMLINVKMERSVMDDLDG